MNRKPHIVKCPTTGVYFCYRWLSFGVGLSPMTAFIDAKKNEDVVHARLAGAKQ